MKKELPSYKRAEGGGKRQRESWVIHLHSQSTPTATPAEAAAFVSM